MKNLLFLGCFAMGLMLMPANAEEHSALGKQMESMNDAFKAFRRETDPVKGATHARDAQQAALKCASEIPEMVEQMPDGPEKIKAALEYRKMLGKLFVTLCEVEGAFLAGNTAEVAKIVDSLKEAKKAGHDKFIEKEKE
jgi:soluble cytochrome b562